MSQPTPRTSDDSPYSWSPCADYIGDKAAGCWRYDCSPRARSGRRGRARVGRLPRSRDRHSRMPRTGTATPRLCMTLQPHCVEPVVSTDPSPNSVCPSRTSYSAAESLDEHRTPGSAQSARGLAQSLGAVWRLQHRPRDGSLCISSGPSYSTRTDDRADEKRGPSQCVSTQIALPVLCPSHGSGRPWRDPSHLSRSDASPPCPRLISRTLASNPYTGMPDRIEPARDDRTRPAASIDGRMCRSFPLSISL